MYVEYETTHGTLCGGYVIDQGESPLTGRYRLLVADSPHDSPADDGKWINAADCEEVDNRPGWRNGQHIGQFI